MIKLCITVDDYDIDVTKLGNAAAKLVKAYSRGEDVCVEEDDISNTLKRKLARDPVTMIINIKLLNQDLTMEFCKADKGIDELCVLYKENLTDYISGRKDGKNGVNVNWNIDIITYIEQGIYTILTRYYNKELPWGMMTGVHPAKPAIKMLMDNSLSDEVKEMFKRKYFVSENRADMVCDIAKKECDIINRNNIRDSYSLYIGIPFCPTTCVYCSFASYTLEKFSSYVDAYIDTLLKEIEQTVSVMSDKKLVSIYIGGGTPTSLNSRLLKKLLEKVKSEFNFEHVREFTVEAGRPDSIDMDKLSIMKEYKVTRISVNPQTMNQSTLDIIGRKHTVEDIYRVYDMARKAGHDNINMDLIMGLMGENIDDAIHTVREVAELNPESITVHTLAIKRAASLNIHKPEYRAMVSDNVAGMVDAAREILISENYEPYYIYRQKNMYDNLENVGYAKKGFECIYNVLMMEEVQTIVACGAGTVTKRVYPDNTIKRCDSPKDIKLYINNIDEIMKRKRQLLEG